jgi:hypothetical protein
MRLLRDFVLIPLPFAVLSALFFIGDVPKMGIGTAVVAALALWYIRPRHGVDPPEEDPPETVQRNPGAGGGGIGL